MVRKGIKREEVFAAASSMLARGDNPTVKAVRESLGTGSMTTVSKYLNEWFEDNDKRKSQEVVKYDFNIEEAFGSLQVDTIAEFLSNEHPQMIALIISHFKAERAARILDIFTPDKCMDIVDRIEKLVPVQHRILANLDKVIREEVKYFEETAETHTGGADYVAKLRAQMRGVSHGE